MFNQVFPIPLAAHSYLFFVPSQAFVWPLDEPSNRNKLVETKVAREGSEGVSFSPYQFYNLAHHVTARALLPAQRRE